MVKLKIEMVGDTEFEYRYSDEGRYLLRDGAEYTEAWDPIGSGRKYTEGDIIPVEPDPEERPPEEPQPEEPTAEE